MTPGGVSRVVGHAEAGSGAAIAAIAAAATAAGMGEGRDARAARCCRSVRRARRSSRATTFIAGGRLIGSLSIICAMSEETDSGTSGRREDTVSGVRTMCAVSASCPCGIVPSPLANGFFPTSISYMTRPSA